MTWYVLISFRYTPMAETAFNALSMAAQLRSILATPCRSDEGCREVINAQQNIIKEQWRHALKGHNNAIMVAFPDYENKGDSAIWVGEQILLASLGVKVCASHIAQLAAARLPSLIVRSSREIGERGLTPCSPLLAPAALFYRQ